MGIFSRSQAAPPPEDHERASERETVQFSVRNVTTEDADALVEIFTQLDAPAQADVLARRIARWASDDKYGAWVATSDADGTLVGLAAGHLAYQLDLEHPVAQLSVLITVSSARGSGIGPALVERFEVWAREHHAGRASVVSGQHRLGGHRRYEQFGFEGSGSYYTKRLT